MILTGSTGMLTRAAALLIAASAILTGSPGQAASRPRASLLATYLVLGEDGARVARAVTAAYACPSITVDGKSSRMSVRAEPATIAQRPTRSAPEDSKLSAFPILICEATVPARAKAASLAGRPLPMPPAVINRIVVFGDTGCRVKKSDNAYQACNDADEYPFAKVAAQAARWRPDLVVHVGDYLYRENACAPDKPGCAGTPWGYGWDAWRADFFTPGEPLLRAAPLILVRGNHESCNRAGQGWWRLLDPRPLVAGRDCNDPSNDNTGDYSDPYAVPFGGGLQLIVYDSSDTPFGAVAAGSVAEAKYRDTYAKIAALTAKAPHNILADHHPILGFAAVRTKAGAITLMPGNGGLLSVFGAGNPGLVPANVDMLLSGHIHLWEMTSFANAYPVQFIAGFGGTQEDIVPLPPTVPPGATPAPGAVVQAISSWVDGFGYMTMERVGADDWNAQLHDLKGAVVNTCEVRAAKATCAVAQVAHK
jgi:hypothetical protein